MWLLIGSAALAALVALSLMFGARGVSFGDGLAAVGGSSDTISQAAVLKRMPRTVLALFVGASLAVAGATMQAVTRNPLADPGILGVSSGAALAVVIGIAFFGLSDPYSYMGVAVLGAMISAAFVYLVGSLGFAGASPLKLALTGAATSAAFASLINAILLPRLDVMTSFRFWQVGGVGGASWERIGVALPFLLAGLGICFANARSMNSLALGDDIAAGLGASVARTRLWSALGAVVLVGVSTSIAGPIAFVGLVVPHLCRLLVGSDHRWLLPLSALGGAALLIASDVVGRLIARPEEIEVGIITAVLGAPMLVWVASRSRIREL